MHNLQSLKCFLCSSSLLEFVVLACGHAICGECFASGSDSQSPCRAIQCSCGVTTNFYRQKFKERESALLKPCSSMPSCKKNKGEILDQSAFTIFETRQSSSLPKFSKISVQNQRKSQSYQTLPQYLMAQLSNQIKFMELRFKRYLNQINRSFNKIISDLNHKYEKLLEEMMKQCHFKIQMSEITCISTIQKIVQRAFKPRLQKKLKQISKTLSMLFNYKSNYDQQKQNVFKQSKIPEVSFNQCKRRSTHQFCKTQTIHSPFHLQSTAKDSKIKKKQARKLDRTKFQLI